MNVEKHIPTEAGWAAAILFLHRQCSVRGMYDLC